MTYSVENVGDEQNKILSIIHTSEDGGQRVVALQVGTEYADKIAAFLNTEAGVPAESPEAPGDLTKMMPYEVIINILRRDKTTDDILVWLEREGISLDLNWGEDNNQWECNFINGRGKRYNAVRKTLRQGIRECIKKMAQAELGMAPVILNTLEDY